MKSESLFTLTMIGAAAVGGLMAGTCFAIKETLGSKQARKCLVLGYAMWGLTAGVLGMALGVWFPVFDANSIREALLIGASFGAVCVFLFATANLGRSITFKLYGWTVEIKPYSGNSKDR